LYFVFALSERKNEIQIDLLFVLSGVEGQAKMSMKYA
jgi:hypothetical protein